MLFPRQLCPQPKPVTWLCLILSAPQSVQAEALSTSLYRYLRSFLHWNHASQITPKPLPQHSMKLHHGLLCTALQGICPIAVISLAELVLTEGSRVGNCSIKEPKVKNREWQTRCWIFHGQELAWMRCKYIAETGRQEGSVWRWLKTRKCTAALNCQGEQLVIIYNRSGQMLKA